MPVCWRHRPNTVQALSNLIQSATMEISSRRCTLRSTLNNCTSLVTTSAAYDVATWSHRDSKRDVAVYRCVDGGQSVDLTVCSSQEECSPIPRISLGTNLSVGCVRGLQKGKHQHWVAQDVNIIKVPEVCKASDQLFFGQQAGSFGVGSSCSDAPLEAYQRLLHGVGQPRSRFPLPAVLQRAVVFLMVSLQEQTAF